MLEQANLHVSLAALMLISLACGAFALPALFRSLQALVAAAIGLAAGIVAPWGM